MDIQQLTQEDINEGLDFIQDLTQRTYVYLLPMQDSSCLVRFQYKGAVHEGLIKITPQMLLDGFPKYLPMVHSKDISKHLYPLALSNNLVDITATAQKHNKTIFVEHTLVSEVVCSLHAAIQLSLFDFECDYKYFLCTTVEGGMKIYLGHQNWISSREDVEMIVWELNAPRHIDYVGHFPDKVNFHDRDYFYTDTIVGEEAKEGTQYYRICEYATEDGKFKLGKTTSKGCKEADMYVYLYTILARNYAMQFYKDWKYA